VSAVRLPTRSLVPETADEVRPPRCRSRGTPQLLTVSAEEMFPVPALLGVDLSAVAFVGAAVFVVEVAAVAAAGLGEIGGLSRSVMTEGMPVGGFGSW
jgi:hypothetical protein